MNKVQSLITIIIPAILLAVAIAIGLLLNDGFFHTTILPFDLDDRTISYPVLPDTIDGVVCVVITTVVSVGLMILWLLVSFTNTQKLRNPFFYVTIYIVFLGAVLVHLLTNTIKSFRGGLRPHFLEACELNETLVDIIRATGKTWVDIENSKVICLAKEKPEYRWSFPSGHSSTVMMILYVTHLIKKPPIKN